MNGTKWDRIGWGVVLTEQDWFWKYHWLPLMNEKWESIIPLRMITNGIDHACCKPTMFVSQRLSLSTMISMTKTQNMTVTFAAAASGRYWLNFLFFFYFFVKKKYSRIDWQTSRRSWNRWKINFFSLLNKSFLNKNQGGYSPNFLWSTYNL